MWLKNIYFLFLLALCLPLQSFCQSYSITQDELTKLYNYLETIEQSNKALKVSLLQSEVNSMQAKSLIKELQELYNKALTQLNDLKASLTLSEAELVKALASLETLKAQQVALEQSLIKLKSAELRNVFIAGGVGFVVGAGVVLVYCLANK
jgi:chromosome segregation ATPase